MAVYQHYFFLWASLILFSFSNIHPFVMVACREEEGQFFNTSNILSLLYMIACQLVIYMYIFISFDMLHSGTTLTCTCSRG